ncbi:acyl-coenzyme A thioesterase THEM4-like [Anolis sagrei]|uniref:acyl-coenzyme A thioesterase THEM4-like n=1 Tax=Anolis sagrei TaxID=38937 RepID=UPI003520FBB8
MTCRSSVLPAQGFNPLHHLLAFQNYPRFGTNRFHHHAGFGFVWLSLSQDEPDTKLKTDLKALSLGHTMLRNVYQLRKALNRWTIPRYDLHLSPADGFLQSISIPPVQKTLALSPCPSQVRLCHSEKQKDYSLPNSSWSPEMMDQYNKLTEMTKDGTWQRLISYRNTWEHASDELMQKHNLKENKGTRQFLRNLDEEGKGFEYAMFLNKQEKQMAGVFQFGPYLEGPPGCAHGGSIATVLDIMLGVLAMCAASWVMTANLSVNYKSPVPLGSVVIANSKVDRMEGRKVFVSGAMQSANRKTLHAEATGLFIQPKKAPGDDGPSFL